MVLLLASCALMGGGHAKDEPEDQGPASRDITLHVENDNFYDATVYALAPAGERRRLGAVTGNSQATFTFRWNHDELRVLIQLLAGRSSVTAPLPVDPGDTLNLVIQPDLHLRIPSS